MDRRSALARCLAVSVACTLALYAYSWSVSPRTLPISGIGSDDVGAMVRTEGHVRSAESLSSGGVKLELLDYSDFASINLPAEPVTRETAGGKTIFKRGGATGARVGKGGPEIRCETLNGDIIIKKNG